MPRLSCFVAVLTALLAARAFAGEPPPVPGRASPSAPPDVLFITSITPAGVVHDQEVEVVAKVSYQLVTQETAMLSFGFNHTRPEGNFPVVNVPVSKGSGEIELRARVVPRFWSELIGFKAGVFLVGPGDPTQPRPALAADQVKIPISVGNAAQAATARQPKPEGVYENGVAIRSVRPDTLTVGIEQEVVVRVSYELFSREAGEIMLTATNGHPNRSSAITKVPVKLGKGDVEIRGKITPRKTGGLPFTKINAALLEVPRAPRTGALGHDEFTVSVEEGTPREAPASPVETVRAYGARIKAQGMASIVDMTHPDELAKFQGMIQPVVELAFREPKGRDEFAIFADPKNPAHPRTLSAPQFMATFFQWLEQVQPLLVEVLQNSSFEPIGQVKEGEITHVVTRCRVSLRGSEIEKLEVISTRDFNGHPKVILSGEIKQMGELLRRSMEQSSAAAP